MHHSSGDQEDGPHLLSVSAKVSALQGGTTKLKHQILFNTSWSYNNGKAVPARKTEKKIWEGKRTEQKHIANGLEIYNRPELATPKTFVK